MSLYFNICLVNASE